MTFHGHNQTCRAHYHINLLVAVSRVLEVITDDIQDLPPKCLHVWAVFIALKGWP